MYHFLSNLQTLNMKQNSATEFDPSYYLFDDLMKTPINRCNDQLVPSCIDLLQAVETDNLEDLLNALQEVIPSSSNQSSTPSLYDELFLPHSSKKCNATPQLDFSRLDDLVLHELNDISTDLINYTANRRGQKVKKRLFSYYSDEPSPKRQRRQSIEDSTDSVMFSELTWSTTGRRS